MPPRPPVANTIQLVVRGTLAGEPCDNIFHMSYSSSPPTPTDMQNVTTSMATQWAGTLVRFLASQYVFDELVGTDLSSDTGATFTATSGTAGGSGSSATQNQVAGLINWAIARRYRGGKPRTYLGGIPGGFLADTRTLSTSALSSYNSEITSWHNSFAASYVGGFTTTGMVVVSYFSKAINPTPPHLRITPATFPIDSGAMNPLLATQRRRLGRG